MCILSIAKNKKHSLEMLEQFETANKDGGGIGWFGSDGKAHFKKNLTAKEIFDISRNIPLPYVVHNRLTSTGGTHPLLTHPFVVSKHSPLSLEGKSDRLLFHNGHVGSWELLLSAANLRFPKGEPVSDTRAIAAISTDNESEFLSLVNGNYAVMNAKTHKINLYGKFEEEDGIIFSNMNWKYAKKYHYHKTYPNSSSGDWNISGESDYDTGYENYGHNSSGVEKSSRRKEKREAWKKKNALRMALDNKDKQNQESEPIDLTENNGTFELDYSAVKKIHEQPDSNFSHDNTRKILGLPPIREHRSQQECFNCDL